MGGGGGRVGYAAGSCFLMDINLLSHLKLFKTLDRDLHFVQHYMVQGQLSQLLFGTCALGLG